MQRLTVVTVLLLCACQAAALEDDGEMATQVFSAKGLYRSPNYVSDVPAGAALVADNLVVPRPDIYETHRGTQRLSGEFPGGADVISMTEFRGFVIGYSGSGVLARRSPDTGVWTAYAGGPYLPPDGPLTDSEGETLPGRVIFHQTGDSLYFTTSTGVYRLEDPESEPELSGVVQAQEGAVVIAGGAGTALPPSSSFAYRYVWGKRTLGGRLILGAPSGRMAIYNTSTSATINVDHVVPVPDEVRAVDGYFLQVYRSQTFDVNVVPDDEMALVFERSVEDMPPTGPYSFTDIDPTPRGATAYFSPSVGSLTDSKYRPPLATDVVTVNGVTVFLNAKGLEAVELTLLGVGAPNGLDIGNGLRLIDSNGNEEEYIAQAVETPPNNFALYTTGTPSQNIAQTAINLVRLVNARSGGFARASYVSDDNTEPGRIRIEARSLAAGPITVQALQSGSMWAPALTSSLSVTTMFRSSNVVTVNFGNPHGLVVGQSVVLTNEFGVPGDAANFPPGTKVIASVPLPTQFTYAEVGPDANLAGSAKFVTAVTDLTTEATKYSVAWTPLQEPDAVPVLQNAQAGNPDLPVLRALLMDGSLYLLKRDGLFRLQGNSPNTLTVDAIDTTVQFIAPWASWTLGGRAYALTTEGLKVWSVSAKPQPASVPIEQDLLDAISRYRAAVDTLAYVVNYESERRLYLAMPSVESDFYAQYFYVYSYLTDTWTRYLQPSNTAMVSPSSDRMVIAPPESSQLLIERKTRTNADFQGPDGEAIPVTLQYTAQIGGNTVDSKHWGRFYFYFEGASPTQVTASFTTEITTTPQSIAIPGTTSVTPGTLETLVPPETARSRFLYPQIQHSVAREPFRLLGYTVRHRNYRAQ